MLVVNMLCSCWYMQWELCVLRGVVNTTYSVWNILNNLELMCLIY